MSGDGTDAARVAPAPSPPESGPPEPAGATRIAAGALLAMAAAGEAARAGPHLVVREPGLGERVVPLLGDLVIGRGRSAGLRLHDPAASRRHAVVRVACGGALEVEDLGSKNGLRLDGRPLRRQAGALVGGGVLAIGGAELRFVDPLAAPVGAAPGGPPAAPGAPAGLARSAPLAGVGPATPGLLAVAAALLALAAGLLALAG